ncbi:MAG: hypothetical protein V1775_18305 [Bacteroidota bacterium]
MKRYPMCRATLYSYLNTPVKKLLRELDEKQEKNGPVLKFDF